MFYIQKFYYFSKINKKLSKFWRWNPINFRHPIADFYKGKQISLQVGFGAGGGYDTTARIFARHFGKYVPGKPNVVVQNVPGAGSMKLVSRLYNVAPKNCTVIGLVSPGTMVVPLYGKRKVKFTVEKFN